MYTHIYYIYTLHTYALYMYMLYLYTYNIHSYKHFIVLLVLRLWFFLMIILELWIWRESIIEVKCFPHLIVIESDWFQLDFCLVILCLVIWLRRCLRGFTTTKILLLSLPHYLLEVSYQVQTTLETIKFPSTISCSRGKNVNEVQGLNISNPLIT